MDEFQGRASDSYNYPKHAGERVPMRRTGLALAVTGAILIALFAVFMLTASAVGSSLYTPMWIGMSFGALMLVYGLYRFFRGPSVLDHPEGGTNAGRL